MDERRLELACIYGDHEVVLDICQEHRRAVTNTFGNVDIPMLETEYPQGPYGHNVTCLHIASGYGHVECCRVLLDCGADVDAKDGDSLTPLMFAKTCEVVILLLSRGANVNAVDERRGWTALHHYASTCTSLDKRCVGELVSAGASVTAEDHRGVTPLRVLIFYAKGDVRQLDFGLELVKRGADANTTDQRCRTLLHLCAGKLHDCVGLENQRSHIISKLVQLGANLEARTGSGTTALHIATESDQKETVFQLIKLGADVNAFDKDEKNKMLLLSLKTNHIEVTAKLFSLGADANTSKESQTALHDAAKAGYTDHVQKLAKAGAGTEARDKHGNTPLLLAAENGHTKTMCALTDAGAATDACNRHGETAIHLAAKNGHTQTVWALANTGATTDECNRYGETAIHLAAKNGHTKTVCALADAGVALDVCNENGETAVHLAAMNGHTNTVVQLVAYGAPFDSFDKMGFTPIVHAIQGGLTATAHELRKAGATLEGMDKDGNTCLHHAVKTNQHELVKPLVEAGASVQALNRDGESALLLAAKLDLTLAATNLLEAGASVEARDKEGTTSLSIASKRGNGELCCELVRYGATVDDTISFFTCLSNAVKAGDTHQLGQLVTVGAMINERDENGSSALHVALNSNHPELAEWIIEHGGEISLPDHIGQTPLHIAARNDCTSIATKLLEAGASAEVCDNDGNTAVSVASKRGNGKLCCELVRYGAKVDETVSFFACLSNAVQAGDTRLLSCLLTIGASIDEIDENSTSPLHIALNSGRTEVAEWIIERGGDVSLADTSGLTPLHLVAKSNIVSYPRRLRLVKLLLAKGADPTAVTGHSQTALDIARQHRDYNVATILEKAELAHELVKAGGAVGSPDSVAIRFGGPPGAGKSTLTDALQVTRVRGIFRYESQTDEGAANSQLRTKGINCHNFIDEKSSRFTIFDLGGHGEFLATHQMFIGDGLVPVIDCVVVSALDEKLKENALKWCSLFASRNQPVATPWPLLLIATRADKATQQQKMAVISAYREVERTFIEHFRFPCSTPLFIDARKSWDELTVQLRKVLNRLNQELVDDGDSQRKPAICQRIEENLPALRRITLSPVIHKEQFMEFMLPRVGLRGQTAVITPAVVSLFDKALKYLSGNATVLFFGQLVVERYVVINPQWLLSEIVGRLMAEPPLPGPHVLYDNGYAMTSDVITALETEHLPGREALEMVSGLGFCLEQKSTDTVLNPSKLRAHRLDEHWRRTAIMVVNAGRRLKCKGTVAIASAFFSHLQVHFYHRYLSDYDQKLPMWTGGIRLVARQRSSVEAIIETDPSNLSIDIIVRGRQGSERDCSDLLHSLTEETLQKATEISPGSQLRLFFLSKIELDELSPAGLRSRPLVEYSEERVLRAIRFGEFVIDGKAGTPEHTDDLLLPRHFQQRSELHNELKAEPAEPLTQTLSTEEWRAVLYRVANAVNSYDECHGLAEGLQLNARGEDNVKKLLQTNPHRETSDAASRRFELWLKRDGNQLSTEQRRRKLNGVFRVNLRRPVLCDILNDKLRMACNNSAH